jgi:hypothetical protein
MHRSQVRRASAAAAILLSGAVALIVLLGSAGVSSAAGLLQAATAADTRAAAGKGPSFDNLTARSRIVHINSAELSRHVAPLGADTAADRISRASRLDGIIRIELFPDVVATFHRKAIEAAGDSGFAWTGDIDRNPLYYATLIIEDGEVTGHIQLLDRLFRIDPIGGGLHRVTELIPSRFGEELVEPVKPSRSGSAPRGGLGETRGKSTITVLIGYTAAAKQQDPNIKRTIKQAVALANVGYANTGVPIRLVVADIVSAGDYA